jgi:thiamine transport system permease protein
MLILAMPGIVLATGFFTVQQHHRPAGKRRRHCDFHQRPDGHPLRAQVLENPMRDVNSRYGLLCQSLGMQGWQRLKVVELRALKRPLAQALAFACVCRLAILAWWRFRQ